MLIVGAIFSTYEELFTRLSGATPETPETGRDFPWPTLCRNCDLKTPRLTGLDWADREYNLMVAGERRRGECGAGDLSEHLQSRLPGLRRRGA